jgi:beta-glucosidase
MGPGVTVNYVVDNKDGAAVAAAKAADVAIVFAGNHPTCDAGWDECPSPSDGKESVDRKSLKLDQEELVQQVLAANPKTVLVLTSSFPYAINWSQEHVPAILHMTHDAQEEGNALAAALLGDVNPGGRLVQTWVRDLDQLPPIMDYNIRHGRTYLYYKGMPLYPFGYGLSYTSFAYSNLRLSAANLSAKGSITVSFDVKNTGTRPGDEVPQLYVTHLKSKVERPLKELRGFRRVTLQPGETKTVELPLAAQSLAYWDEKQAGWVVELDHIKLAIGSSSSDQKLTRNVSVMQ